MHVYGESLKNNNIRNSFCNVTFGKYWQFSNNDTVYLYFILLRLKKITLS